jgi:hypothetical protein
MPYDPILELMSVPEAPQFYVLGAYAKRVTIYSQQVRAINLVDAIWRYHREPPGPRIAIVGGGIAGLTAASRMLEYVAARAPENKTKVSIFEQNADFISIQSDATHRWVHPHLYEWPNEESGAHLNDADIPQLSWHAQDARGLSKELRDKWKEIADKQAELVEERRSTMVTRVEADAGKYRLTWKSPPNGSAEESGKFDIVILALGYGLEPGADGRISYWRPDGMDWIGQPGEQRVLVAGYGDGALTDLMRACLLNFDHESILKEVIKALQPSDIESIRELEDDLGAVDAEELTRGYCAAHFPKVVTILKDKQNKLRKVVLTGPGPNLFDPAASTLNRLVVSQLLRMKAFQHIGLTNGERIKKPAQEDLAIAGILARTDPKLDSFTDIVLRFGTKKILPSSDREPQVALDKNDHPVIEGLPDGLKAMRSRWENMRASDDPTRRPLWILLEPLWKTSPALQNTPPTPANLSRCVLTLDPAAANPKGRWLPGLVNATTALLNLDKVLPFDPIPLALDPDKCASNPEALAFTARALSRVPIAIFNLGGKMGQENPTGMLLLGIRAAVRRGLTLVIFDRSDQEPDWDELPFNIRELLVLPLKSGQQPELYSVLRSGWTAMQLQTKGYRDLPVFDAVRHYARRSPPVPDGKVEIFALCPFNPDYLKNTWPKLFDLITAVGAHDKRRFDLKPVTEYLSPMLVSERVYDLTRFADRCMVDWTYWRANVFFELGVRLAVSKVPPICVIRSDQQHATNASAALLQTFSPIAYDLESGESAEGDFGQAFLKAERQIRDRHHRLRQVYDASERNAGMDQELGYVPLEQELFGQVTSIIGSDFVREGSFKFLYSSNPSLSRQMLRNLVDRLDAALLLVESKIKRLKADDDGYDRLDGLRKDTASRLQEMRDFGRQLRYLGDDDIVNDTLRIHSGRVIARSRPTPSRRSKKAERGG